MKENVKEILNFLLKVNELKEKPRTGWVLMRVEKPETIAEHTFRTTISSWLLARKKNLNLKKIIKIALFHDLCEVYAGDATPFFYWDGLKREKPEEEEILLRGIRLSLKEKEKRAKIKFKREKQSLLRLISSLSDNLKREIFSSWLDYEKKISREGKFVSQVDRIETLLQSIEYFGSEEIKGGTSWWEGTEERVEDPLLLEFLKIIQNKFYQKKIKNIKDEKELEDILDFLLEIGKLKKMPRRGWVLREVKNPETMAGHIFESTLMAWLFLKNSFSVLKEERILKMALCHELSKIYAGDKTPYDKILEGKSEKEKKEILRKWIRFSKKEKAENFLNDYRNEKSALERLTLKLEEPLRNEIIQIWEEFKTVSSPEARFFNQIDILAVLFQALLYWQRDKNFPIDSFWEWAFEVSEGQMNLEFIEELKKKFYKKKPLLRTLFSFSLPKSILKKILLK